MTKTEKQEFLNTFGNRIRQYRIKKQMSLDELARKCGYSSNNARSSMQKIETGKSDIPASKVKLIAKALEIPISEIMGWVDEKDHTHKTNSFKNEAHLIEQIENQYGKTTSEAFSLYTRLDSDDQGEIRGEMKHMLKSDKYAKKTYKNKNSCPKQ